MEILTFIGIDPGQDGAIALIDAKQDDPDYYDMPLLPNNEIDVREIKKILHNLPAPFCILEHANVMPNQGAVGGFTYGCGYGALKAVLTLMRIPFEEIRPQKWKKEFSLIKAKEKIDKSLTTKQKNAIKTKLKKIAKEESVTKVLELFPGMSKDDFYTPKGRLLDGRAEAVLICEYGRRTHFRGGEHEIRNNREVK